MQVQLVYKDSKIVNQIIDELDAYVDKPQPKEVPVIPLTQPSPTPETVPSENLDATPVQPTEPVVEAEVVKAN